MPRTRRERLRLAWWCLVFDVAPVLVGATIAALVTALLAHWARAVGAADGWIVLIGVAAVVLQLPVAGSWCIHVVEEDWWDDFRHYNRITVLTLACVVAGPATGAWLGW